MPDLKKRAARKGLSDSTINACKERRDLEGLVSKGLPQEVTPLASAPLLDQRPPAINPAAKQNEEQAPCCEVPTAVPTAAPPRTKDVDSTTTAGSSRQEGEMAAAMALAAALGMALASDDEQDLGFHTGRRVLKGRCVGSCCDCQTRCGGQCNDKSHCNGDCQWSCCGKKGRRVQLLRARMCSICCCTRSPHTRTSTNTHTLTRRLLQDNMLTVAFLAGILARLLASSSHAWLPMLHFVMPELVASCAFQGG